MKGVVIVAAILWGIGWTIVSVQEDKRQEEEEAAYASASWDHHLCLLRTLAHKGDVDAQARLGFELGMRGRYIHDEEDRREAKESVRWLEAAAEQGDAEAQTVLGAAYLDETKEEDGMLSNSLLYLTDVLYPAPAVERRDNRIALHWLERAAGQGYSQGQLLLGLMYEYGYGTERDLPRAKDLYLRAHRSGNPAGACALQQFMWDRNEEAHWEGAAPSSESSIWMRICARNQGFDKADESYEGNHVVPWRWVPHETMETAKPSCEALDPGPRPKAMH